MSSIMFHLKAAESTELDILIKERDKTITISRIIKNLTNPFDFLSAVIDFNAWK